MLDGRHTPRRRLSVAQAKARLREVDAGLDIGPVLSAVTRGQWRSAVLSLLAWFNTDAGRAFIAPLMLKLLPLAIGLLDLLRPHKKRVHTPAQSPKDKADS